MFIQHYFERDSIPNSYRNFLSFKFKDKQTFTTIIFIQVPYLAYAQCKMKECVMNQPTILIVFNCFESYDKLTVRIHESHESKYEWLYFGE